jgi:hypothetical protein
MDDGAESSKLCSDWKSTAGALDFLCDPKQGIAVDLLLVRYCLVGGATAAIAPASEWCIGGVEPECSDVAVLDVLRPGD